MIKKSWLYFIRDRFSMFEVVWFIELYELFRDQQWLVFLLVFTGGLIAAAVIHFKFDLAHLNYERYKCLYEEELRDQVLVLKNRADAIELVARNVQPHSGGRSI